MMLSLLLKGVVPISVEQDCEITSLTIDSRDVVKGSLFVALKGTQQHGLNYASSVAEKGAAAIIWESDVNTQTQNLELPQIEVNDLRDNLGEIANRFYSSPSQSLNVIGITGTDGKTSVSHFIAQSLNNCAVMGTLGIGLLSDLQTATHTTPDVITTHKNIATMELQQIKSVAMEVSSHALDQGRVAGVNFDVAVLTNLTRDHLDYHGTVEAYAEAKAKLFAWSDLKALVLNLDDEFGVEMAQKWGCVFNNASTTAYQTQIIGYGVGSIADYPANSLVAVNAEFNSSGLSAQIHFDGQVAELKASVLGRFNLSNLLAALGAILALGDSLQNAVTELNKVHTVAGRIEKVSDADVLAVVDYAHTPNALETVLKALREHTQNQLICVFGCGGDRDAGKRPLMAKIAEANSDVVIVTDDNPRSEDPQIIMKDIVAGFIYPAKATVEYDRATAIRLALKQASSGDTVLIAGKGHENYQILASGTIDFSDREEANKALQELAA
ncbi:MAG: UDP-N-acetylmuramoyl-L-alanyl-D-glutamate--2,6-diaminopimelate ligase [Cocleimonas sp.]